MGSTELEAFFLCLAKVPVLGITFLIEYPFVSRCFARGEITDSILRVCLVNGNIRSSILPFFSSNPVHTYPFVPGQDRDWAKIPL